jgi:hypothetical protein
MKMKQNRALAVPCLSSRLSKMFSVFFLVLLLLIVIPTILSSSTLFVVASAVSAATLPSPSPSTSTIHIITTIRVGDESAFAVYDPSNKFVYVINSNSDYRGLKNQSVSIINSTSNTVVATVEIGVGQSCCIGGYDNIIYAPPSKEIFVINNDNLPGDGISIIKGTKRVANIDVSGPGALAYDPQDRYVYLTANSGLYVIDPMTNKIIGLVAANGTTYYESIIYDPSNQELYATAWTSGFSYMVVVAIKGLSAVSVIKPVSHYSQLGIFAFDPSNKGVYVTYDYNPNGIYYSGLFLINSSTNKIIANIKVAYEDSYIDSIQYNPANKNMYVVDFANPNGRAADNLTMINSFTNKVKVIIRNNLSGDVFQMTFDPTNNDLYVPAGGLSLYILTPRNNITALQYKGAAEGSLYDPSNKDVYIVDGYTDSYVTVVSS